MIIKSPENRIRDIYNWANGKFFNHDIPLPKIAIVDHGDYAGSSYVGIKGSFPSSYGTCYFLEIRIELLRDEESLKRIVVHEMIHLWQFHQMQRWNPKTLYQLVKSGDAGDAHKQDFLDYMNKINSIMGSNFVTLTYDKAYPILIPVSQ